MARIPRLHLTSWIHLLRCEQVHRNATDVPTDLESVQGDAHARDERCTDRVPSCAHDQTSQAAGGHVTWDEEEHARPDGAPCVPPRERKRSGLEDLRWGQRRFSEWDEDGNIHQLPGLDDTPEINALGINNRGVIVGSEMTAEFVATERASGSTARSTTSRIRSPAPEYRLRSAVDINSAFVAAIWARAPGGRAGKGASPCVEISTPP